MGFSCAVQMEKKQKWKRSYKNNNNNNKNQRLLAVKTNGLPQQAAGGLPFKNEGK